MKYDSFYELEKVCDMLVEKGDLEKALSVFHEGELTLPKEEREKHKLTIINNKLGFFYKCQMYDELFNSLTSMIKEGLPCSIMYYNNIKQDPRYAALKVKNDILLTEAQKKSRFEYVVYTPEGYTKEKKYPVFFNMHGDGDNIEYHKGYWKPDKLLSMGFIVVYPQSSQVSRYNGYKWIDLELTQKALGGISVSWETYSSLYEELRACYDSIEREYSINDEQIIIGGFSGGASCSLDIALAGIIPVKGAIALCSQRMKNFTDENIKEAGERGTRLVFIEGEKDAPVQEVEEMKEDCKRFSLPYQYYINEGIGHWYPEDLDEKIKKAVEFILK